MQVFYEYLQGDYISQAKSFYGRDLYNQLTPSFEKRIRYTFEPVFSTNIEFEEAKPNVTTSSLIFTLMV